jgi:hypothetical protein
LGRGQYMTSETSARSAPAGDLSGRIDAPPARDRLPRTCGPTVRCPRIVITDCDE